MYYIIRKISGRDAATEGLCLLRDVFDCVAPDRGNVNQAIDSECDDFEDAVQFHSAGFPLTGPAILNPDEFLALYAEQISE